MSQALLREIKTTIKNYKLYNYLPVNCRTIGGPISGGKRQERRPCIHLINNMENPSTSGRQLLNSDLVIVRLIDQAAQKSRFRCFVLASLRTSREALLYIWGVPMFVMFINYKHYNHWHTPNVK